MEDPGEKFTNMTETRDDTSHSRDASMAEISHYPRPRLGIRHFSHHIDLSLRPRSICRLGKYWPVVSWPLVIIRGERVKIFLSLIYLTESSY